MNDSFRLLARQKSEPRNVQFMR